MGERTADRELVLQALIEHGLELDESDDPNVFWISYKVDELEYEVEIDLNFISKYIICLNSFLPFRFDDFNENLIYFLNRINSEINFGKFFFQNEDNVIVYRRVHKYVSEELAKEDVILHLRIVYTFHLSYEQEFKEFFANKEITIEEIDKMFIRREKRKGLDKK